MAKASPEKLAKALRANLKKRKAGPGEGAAATPKNPSQPPDSGPVTPQRPKTG